MLTRSLPHRALVLPVPRVSPRGAPGDMPTGESMLPSEVVKLAWYRSAPSPESACDPVSLLAFPGVKPRVPVRSA